LPQRQLVFVGSSIDDLRSFPEDVKDVVGYALWLAQDGQKHPDAKPLKGFGGAGVLEIADAYRGDAYRVIYTTTFADVVCVLHAFKKSTSGITTPKQQIDVIKRRLRIAAEIHAERKS
jgi:phage-related protein